MKHILQLSVIAACATLQACSVLSPYTPVAEPFCASLEEKAKPESGRDFACHYSREYESKATAAAYYSSTSTIALAGVLGLGAYKAVAASSGHQYLALAAGGGALYGAGLALYKPTREQVWMGGSAAMSCLDDFYRDFDQIDIAKNDIDANKIALGKDASRYESAMRISTEYNKLFEKNIRIVAHAVNRLLSNLQPTTSESYAAVSKAINENMPSKTESFSQSAPPGDSTQKLINWIDGVEARHAEIKAGNLKPQCSIFSTDFVIAGFPSNGRMSIKVGETKKFTILDGSGFFTIKTAPESTAVESRFESENGVRSIIITGKTATTTPIFQTFIDSDTGVSRTLEISVDSIN